LTDEADLPTLESLRGAVDTGFDLTLDARGRTLELRLVEIHARDAPKGYEQFAMQFVGPSDPQLPQAIYAFRHRLGAFPLFIVPIGRDEAGIRYEACVIRRA
jgi:hypothetical protein